MEMGSSGSVVNVWGAGSESRDSGFGMNEKAGLTGMWIRSERSTNPNPGTAKKDGAGNTRAIFGFILKQGLSTRWSEIDRLAAFLGAVAAHDEVVRERRNDV